MKHLLQVVTLFLFTITLSAQSSSVNGMIKDDKGESMEFVNILLLNAVDSSLVKGSVSEQNGTFVIDRIESGNYLINASMVGFTDAYSNSFELNGETSYDLPAMTITSGFELSEIMVTAQRPFIEMRADKIIVNVENSSINAGNSALEILQKSPGVIVDQDDNISLRGKRGVLIMINGKNQYMSGDEIARMLSTMPASNIDNIEIITNPSAKYDAEGDAGIINIKLKRNEKLGYNGQTNIGYRQGDKMSYNGNLSLNHRSEKINIYGRGSYYHWAGFNDLTLNRVIPFESGSTTFDQISDIQYKGNSYDYRLGLDFSPNDKTTIGLLAKLNTGDSGENIDNMTNIFGSNAPNYDLLNVISQGDEDWDQYSFNGNLKQSIGDKTELSIDADYSVYSNPGLSMYENKYLDSEGEGVDNPLFLRNNVTTDIDIAAVKVDLTTSLPGGIQLETGSKISMVSTDNLTMFEMQDGEDWVDQPDRSNTFTYDEDVAAGYVNLSKAIGKVQLQGGLRLEHTVSDGFSPTLDQRVERTYTDLFPSVSLSHMWGAQTNVSYTYSRRLDRPNYKSLNPFISYLDEFTFEKGNPFLNPQYSNAFGLNIGIGRSLFISANYSHTTEAITDVIEQLSDINTTFKTEQNLDDFNSMSLTLSAPRVWSEWWTSRISITGFYNDFRSSIPSGTLDNQSAAYNIYFANELALPAKWNMEVTGNYTSGLTYGLFEIDPQYGVDMGISKRVLEGKGNLKISVSDIFYTQKNHIEVSQDDIALVVNNARDTRRVSVNFRYNFGNQKVKAARKRKTATEDETNRIGGNGN